MVISASLFKQQILGHYAKNGTKNDVWLLFRRAAINQFIQSYSKARDPLLGWYLTTKESDWSNLADMKKVFGTVDYVGKDLYDFNVGGNKYRLIARIIFKARTVYIRFVGTHAQYDKVKLSSL